MTKFLIEGHKRLQREILVHGAKNSTLPILAASMLCNIETVLYNYPVLLDVETCTRILRYLGCRVIHSGGDVTIDSSGISHSDVPDYLMREVRSSVAFLGAIAARTGRAKLSFPGGCGPGSRPTDLHLAALRQIGAEIEEGHGCLDYSAPDGLKRAEIGFSFLSVGATENMMIATICAEGTTAIINAARKPEICDLANLLNARGAKIRGAGESAIVIESVAELSSCEHGVIPDRIAAAICMAAATVADSALLIGRIDPRRLEPIIPISEEGGCGLIFYEDELKIAAPQWFQSAKNMYTMPYPGFPTDVQTPVMAMTALANGTSVFVGSIFKSQYKHAGELLRLDANIKAEGRVAVVQGVPRLSSAPVESPDLRGEATLVIAGLAAEGITQMGGLRHIDRSYEQMELSLAAVGTSTQRTD